jgi:hypothetical protein
MNNPSPPRTRHRMAGAVRLAAAGMLGALIAAMPTVSAQAGPAPQPATPMDRCQQRSTPDEAVTLHMPGGRSTTYPGSNRPLRPGDVVRIIPHMGPTSPVVSTTGWWWQPADASNWVSPAGADPRQPADGGYPAPGLNKYSLIGRFGNLRPFEVLRERSCLQLGGFLALDLRINDDQDWDNFGAWDVDVQVYRNAVQDGGFERQRTSRISWPWYPEGPDAKSIGPSDLTQDPAAGSKLVILNSDDHAWNAVAQPIPLRPHTIYRISGLFDLASGINTAFFGVRLPGEWPPRECHFGHQSGEQRPGRCGYVTNLPGDWQQVSVTFDSGDHTWGTAFAGFWGIGAPAFMLIDGIQMLST